MEETYQISVLLKEEEEELVDSLQRKPSRRLSNDGRECDGDAVAVVSINGNGNGNGVYCSSSSSDSSLEPEAANGGDYGSKPSKEEADISHKHNSVYFDEQHGAESIDGALEIRNDAVASSAFEMNSRDADVHDKSLEIQKSLTEETNEKCSKILDHVAFSDSSLTPLEESCEEKNLNSNSFNNNTRLAGEFDLIEDVDQEETEFDVEGVIKKQNTHELFCPNCNSCITRRVILRRKKPKVRHAHRKPKRNKEETMFPSELVANNANSANNQVDETVEINSNDNQALVGDNSNSRQPELFRCLSCFSFFIPTGDGFNLFKLFGNHIENENVQNIQKTPATSTNRSISIFGTDKKKITVEQAGHETLADQNDPISSVAALPKGLVNNSGSSSTRDTKEFVNFSTEENASTGGKKSENATERKDNIGVAASNYATINTVEQLNSICSSNAMLDQHKIDHTATPVTGIVVNKDPADKASLGLMHGADDIPASSTGDSCMLDMSQIDENSDKVIAKIPIQNAQISSIQGTPLPTKSFHEREFVNASAVVHLLKTGVGETASDPVEPKDTGRDVIVVIGTRPAEPAASQGAQNIDDSTEATTLLQSGAHISSSEQRGAGVSVEILKSIIYGGLIESIASLGVVSSAAGAGSSTLNILALGLANVIGGLFMISHNLVELKNDNSVRSSNQMDEQEDHYQETLGRRENFSLHAVVSILSFIIFGMLPPVVYGFSFRKSDDRDLKLAAVGSATLVCIMLLAIGKAHVQSRNRRYISTILYFVSIGIVASGASWIAGNLISKLAEKVGWFEPGITVTTFQEGKAFELGKASY